MKLYKKERKKSNGVSCNNSAECRDYAGLQCNVTCKYVYF